MPILFPCQKQQHNISTYLLPDDITTTTTTTTNSILGLWAGSPPPFPEDNLWWLVERCRLSQAKCSSCHPTINVKALTKHKTLTEPLAWPHLFFIQPLDWRNTKPWLNHWPGLIFSSSSHWTEETKKPWLNHWLGLIFSSSSHWTEETQCPDWTIGLASSFLHPAIGLKKHKALTKPLAWPHLFFIQPLDSSTLYAISLKPVCKNDIINDNTSSSTSINNTGNYLTYTIKLQFGVRFKYNKLATVSCIHNNNNNVLSLYFIIFLFKKTTKGGTNKQTCWGEAVSASDSVW